MAKKPAQTKKQVKARKFLRDILNGRKPDEPLTKESIAKALGALSKPFPKDPPRSNRMW